MSIMTPMYAGNYTLYASPSQRHGAAAYLSAGFPHTAMPVPFLPPEFAAAMPLHPVSALAYGGGQYHSHLHHHMTQGRTTTSSSSASSQPREKHTSGGCINFSIDGILGKTTSTGESKDSVNDHKTDHGADRSGGEETHDQKNEADGLSDHCGSSRTSPQPEQHQQQHPLSLHGSHVPSLADIAKSVDSCDGDFLRDESLDDSDTQARFSWLQCTRYKPPKLPRMKRKDGIKKRKLGRNPRVPFTQHQVSMLEQKFRRTHYLSSVDVAELSAALNLTETRVKIWFQNRRARERRDRENMQQGGLPTSRMTSAMSPSAMSGLMWPGPVPPNPSAVAQFSQALQQGTSAFTPVSFHATSY